MDAALAHIGSERGSSSVALIIREPRVQHLAPDICRLRGHSQRRGRRRIVERMVAVGLVPSLGPWDAASTPKLLTNAALTRWPDQSTPSAKQPELMPSAHGLPHQEHARAARIRSLCWWA